MIVRVLTSSQRNKFVQESTLVNTHYYHFRQRDIHRSLWKKALCYLWKHLKISDAELNSQLSPLSALGLPSPLATYMFWSATEFGGRYSYFIISCHSSILFPYNFYRNRSRIYLQSLFPTLWNLQMVWKGNEI